MRKLNTKYNERALLPAALLNGIQRNDIVETNDGVIVRIEFIGTCNNTNGWREEDLDIVSQNWYGMPFAKVQRAWKMRMPIDDWWHLVKMTRIEDELEDAQRWRRTP